MGVVLRRAAVAEMVGAPVAMASAEHPARSNSLTVLDIDLPAEEHELGLEVTDQLRLRLGVVPGFGWGRRR
jgi:hypothetical protein